MIESFGIKIFIDLKPEKIRFKKENNLKIDGLLKNVFFKL
jgi:hypothetical protein